MKETETLQVLNSGEAFSTVQFSGMYGLHAWCLPVG
jgi:hypothetical protein